MSKDLLPSAYGDMPGNFSPQKSTPHVEVGFWETFSIKAQIHHHHPS